MNKAQAYRTFCVLMKASPAVFAPFELTGLRNGTLGEMSEQVTERLKTIDKITATQGAKFRAGVDARYAQGCQPDVDANRRWTDLAASSKEAYRHCAAVLRTYAMMMDDAERSFIDDSATPGTAVI